MIAAPFRSGPYTVRPEWIDYNGHLNLAYYVMLFDQATDALWDALGIGVTAKAAGHSTFAAESHILYKSELLAGRDRRHRVPDPGRGRQALACRV